MENKKINTADSYEFVRRIVEPIFKKSLQETSKNHMMVGKADFTHPKNCFYQPHNYRLYFDFSRDNFSIKNHTPKYGWLYPKVVNQIEVISKKGLFTVKVKKTQIEIIYNYKRWDTINMSLPVTNQFIQILKRLDGEMLEILKDFIKCFGGKSEFNILRRRSEDKIKGLDIIEKINPSHNFYNNVGKKVYNEKVFEYKNPIYASQSLENQALENNTDKIISAIVNTNPLRFLKSRVKTPQDVIMVSSIIRLLTRAETRDFELWMFKNVGV